MVEWNVKYTMKNQIDCKHVRKIHAFRGLWCASATLVVVVLFQVFGSILAFSTLID